MGKRTDVLVDAIWPRLTGDSSEPTLIDLPVVADPELLSAVEGVVEERVDQERERSQSLDSRLIPLLTTTGIMATVLAAGIPLASSGEGTLSDVQLALLVVPFMYLVLQLLRCVVATLSGLSPRAYMAPRTDAMRPVVDESAVEYRNRLTNSRYRSFQNNLWVANQKLDQLSLAHRAIRNALAGVGLLLISGVIVFALERFEEDAGSSLADAPAAPTATISPGGTQPPPSPSLQPRPAVTDEPLPTRDASIRWCGSTRYQS